MRILLTQLPVPSFRWPHLDPNPPLAGGYLAAYLREHLPRHEIDLLPADEADLLGDEALAAAVMSRRADVVGLTVSLWNVEASIHLGKKLREQGVAVVLGGPEIVPDHPWFELEVRDFTRVAGEGEEAFRRLLEGAIPPPPGLAPRAPSVDLARVSSPYLTGVLSPSPDGTMGLETLRGCPFGCAYCAYGKHRRGVRRFPPGWLADHLAWANLVGVGEVYLMDPSFNVRGDWPAVLDTLEREGGSLAFHTELVADRLDPAHAGRLARAGLCSAEIGLQSADPTVLATAGRPWNRDRWLQGVRALSDAGVSTVVGLIAGLPGDTLDGFRRTVEFVLSEAPAAEIQVFPLSLLPGTGFRARAAELGLVALERPPYTVLRTPGFPPGGVAEALLEVEDVTGAELDPAGPPPLWGPWAGGEGHPWWSGVVLTPGRTGPEWIDRVASRAARNLTVRLTGWGERVVDDLCRLIRSLPHGVLTVVVDDAPAWPLDELVRLARIRTTPHYLDRHLHHLLGPGGRAVPRVVAVVPVTAPSPARWVADVGAHAEVVWRYEQGSWGWEEVRERVTQGETVWLGGGARVADLEAWATRLGNDAPGVVFEDPALQNRWWAACGEAPARVGEHRVDLGHG